MRRLRELPRRAAEVRLWRLGAWLLPGVRHGAVQGDAGRLVHALRGMRGGAACAADGAAGVREHRVADAVAHAVADAVAHAGADAVADAITDTAAHASAADILADAEPDVVAHCGAHGVADARAHAGVRGRHLPRWRRQLH